MKTPNFLAKAGGGWGGFAAAKDIHLQMAWSLIRMNTSLSAWHIMQACSNYLLIAHMNTSMC